ncbi:MAG TPA: TadE/TadG family type IV pilus assembly protein [Symbiobacteriaceae bacterium]
MGLRASRGSATLEMAVVIPLLITLVFGGAAVAYGALAKASLQMTVMRAARELAAAEAASRMEPDQLYGYKEFTETYGLPRAKVRMLTGQTGGVIVVGACYRIPLPLPRGIHFQKKEPPWPLEIVQTALEAEGMDPQRARETVEDLTMLKQEIDRTYQEDRTLWQQIVALWTRLQQLDLNTPLERREFLPVHGAQVHDLDVRLSQLCAGPGLVVRARSAFWSESSVPLPGPPEPLEVVRLEPNPVNLEGAAPPGVRATIVVRAREETSCSIRVLYRSGFSQAEGLQQKVTTRQTPEGYLAEWQWNVGTRTSTGEWPVQVTCDNGQSVTAYLTVFNPAVSDSAGE